MDMKLKSKKCIFSLNRLIFELSFLSLKILLMLKKLYFAASILCLLSSCVSMKKFKQLDFEHNGLKKDFQDLQVVRLEKEKCEGSLKQTTVILNSTREELADWKGKYSSLEETNQQLNNRINLMIEDNKNVLSSSVGEKQALSDQLAAQKAENDKKERQLKTLEAQLKAKEASMNGLNSDLAEREKKVQDLQAILDAQNKRLMELKNKLNTALKGFSAADLSVREENGKVYVSLSQNLLFATGSDKLDPKGTNALKQLAAVLVANPETDILVEGHTDSDGAADLNWDLSANRALAVTKVLTTNKVEGKRITSAGRGMFVPVADNKDAVGKSKNRRTEIILSPKLDELYKIINN
jgi:chemotaxis protein MotB